MPRADTGLRKEVIRDCTYVHRRKTDTHDEVRRPIDQNANGHGCRPRTLREQFGRYHPRYGARTDGEEHHKSQGRSHRQIRHPTNHILHVAKKLLFKRRNKFHFLNAPPPRDEGVNQKLKIIIKIITEIIKKMKI